jgi:hypothetical protein
MDSSHNLRKEDRLSIELGLFAAHKEKWLKDHSGDYVVAQGTTVLGFFDSWEQAFRSGINAFGVRDDFLVKQVLPQEPVYFVF